MKAHRTTDCSGAALGRRVGAAGWRWRTTRSRSACWRRSKAPFTVLGQDSMRGAELAFKEANYMAGGKKIEVIKGSSDASPDSAVQGRAQARGAGRRRRS